MRQLHYRSGIRSQVCLHLAALALLASGYCSGAYAQRRHDTSEIAARKQWAVILEGRGDYETAILALESMTDVDYLVPARCECYWMSAYVPPTRELALMRCHLALGHTEEAVAIAWGVVERNWRNGEPAARTIAEHADVQGGEEAVHRRLDRLLAGAPQNELASNALAWLQVLHAVSARDYLGLVTALVDASWFWPRGQSDWACVRFICRFLAQHREETIPLLIANLGKQGFRHPIFYALEVSGDPRAVPAIFAYSLAHTDYYGTNAAMVTLAGIGAPSVRYCLDVIETSHDPALRQHALTILLRCSGSALEAGDPGLRRMLSALRDPRNVKGDDPSITVDNYLLRVIALTRNEAFIEPVRLAWEDVGSFGEFGDRQAQITLASLGDLSTIVDIWDRRPVHSPSVGLQ